MIRVRPAAERGKADYGWLRAAYSFSFGDYFDPEHLGFRALRVLNEDRIAGHTGFPKHGHRDMEILTWVLEGALTHRDSLGHAAVIRAGEVQRMTAGRGILHSEANEADEPVHLLQIWIHPDQEGLDPGYEQMSADQVAAQEGWTVLASGREAGGGMHLHRDAAVELGRFAAGEDVHRALEPGRSAWLQVREGRLRLSDSHVLGAGDGASVEELPGLDVRVEEDAEFLLFDLD